MPSGRMSGRLQGPSPGIKAMPEKQDISTDEALLSGSFCPALHLGRDMAIYPSAGSLLLLKGLCAPPRSVSPKGCVTEVPTSGTRAEGGPDARWQMWGVEREPQCPGCGRSFLFLGHVGRQRVWLCREEQEGHTGKRPLCMRV